MVFVTVVMACWVKAQSAILRLFLAMRMFRVLTERPNPLSNCCWNPTKREDCTEGLNKLAAEVEELRVLSHAVKKLVPVWKPCTYCVLNVVVCRVNLVSESRPVPVPEVSGLFAVEPAKKAPGVAPPKPPALAFRMFTSANQGL